MFQKGEPTRIQGLLLGGGTTAPWCRGSRAPTCAGTLGLVWSQTGAADPMVYLVLLVNDEIVVGDVVAIAEEDVEAP